MTSVSRLVGPPLMTQEELVLRTGVAALWEVGAHGDGVTVALLDSGVQEDAFGGRLAWTENFTRETKATDLLGHGTTMARLILGQAPRAKIASIKVIDKDGHVTREQVINGLNSCASRSSEIGIVNVSLGIPRRWWLWSWCRDERPCALCTRTNELALAGMRIVAAVGNRILGSNTLFCPGAAIGAYAIGASEQDPTGRLPRFAKRFFPAVYYYVGEGASGTSVATALASGAIALIMSVFPDVTMKEIRDATSVTATHLGGPDGPPEAHWYRAYKLIAHWRARQKLDLDDSRRHYQAALALETKGEILNSIGECERAIR